MILLAREISKDSILKIKGPSKNLSTGTDGLGYACPLEFPVNQGIAEGELSMEE